MVVQTKTQALEVHDLTVSYNKKPVLWGVDLTIPQGSLVGVIGPNGAGKSTFIKAIMQLVPWDSGYVKIFDQEINNIRKRVSYVPQKESVDWDFPASALDVVLMGRYGKTGSFKRTTKLDKSIAIECLAKVGMGDFHNRQISQLSGGQQQRVFIARALAQEADIYFLDEPFAGVDAASEGIIIELLRGLSKQGKTIVVVHHDLHSASEYFNWIILLNTRLIACGPTVETFTNDLLQKTYGGKLTILTKVGDLLQKQ